MATSNSLTKGTGTGYNPATHTNISNPLVPNKGTYNPATGTYTSPEGVKQSRSYENVPKGTTIQFGGGGVTSGGGDGSATVTPTTSSATTNLPMTTKATPTPSATVTPTTFQTSKDPLGGFSPIYEKGSIVGFSKGGEFIPKELAINRMGFYSPSEVIKGATRKLTNNGEGVGTVTSYTGLSGTSGELIRGSVSSTFNVTTPDYFASYKMTPTATSTSSDIIMPQSFTKPIYVQEELKPYNEFMKGRNFLSGTYEYGAEWLSRSILGTTQQRIGYSDILPYKMRGSISPNAPTFSLISSKETKSKISLRNIQAQQSLSTSIQVSPFIFAPMTSSAGLRAVTGIQMASFGVEKFTTPYGKEQADIWNKQLGSVGKPLYYISGGLEIAGGITQLSSAHKLAQIQSLEKAPKLSVTTITAGDEFSTLKQRSVSRARAPYIFSMGAPNIYAETRATASLFPSATGNLYTIEEGRLGSAVQLRGLLNQPYYFGSQATFSGTLWGTQGRYISKTGGITLEQEAMKSYTGKIKITSMEGTSSISKRFGGYSLTNLGEGKSEILMSGDISRARVYYESGKFKARGLLKPNTLTSYKEFTATEPSGNFRILPSSKTGQVGLSSLEKPMTSLSPQQLSINTPRNFETGTQFKTGEFIPLSKSALQQIGSNLNKGFAFKSINIQKQIPLNKDTQIPKSPLITRSTEITKQVSLIKGVQINALSQSQVTKQVSITKLISPSPNINIPPPFIPPPITTWAFPPFTFGSFGEKLSYKKYKGKQKKKYTPSYEALVFGIRGRQPKGKEMGIGTRPIPKGFSWSFSKTKLKLGKFKL